MVHKGDKVVVDYRLRLDDGTEYANTRKQGEPVEFEIGSGAMLPDFECTVMGMEEGESRSIHVPMNRAYGARDKNLVVTVPPIALPDGTQMPVGAVVGLNTPEGVIRVRVLEVSEGGVRLDCNHELAGRSLDFDITLVGVKGAKSTSAVEQERHSAGCSCGCDRLQKALQG